MDKPDLIDRAEAIGELEYQAGLLGRDQVYRNTTAENIEHLRNIAAVDSEPVRHGRWKLHREYVGGVFCGHVVETMNCSMCGASYDISMSDNYCSNCGAKMDALPPVEPPDGLAQGNV